MLSKQLIIPPGHSLSFGLSLNLANERHKQEIRECKNRKVEVFNLLAPFLPRHRLALAAFLHEGQSISGTTLP